jgi:hypothetical protein
MHQIRALPRALPATPLAVVQDHIKNSGDVAITINKIIFNNFHENKNYIYINHLCSHNKSPKAL